MPDLADALAILQRQNCETLALVRAEVDRIQREKQTELHETSKVRTDVSEQG